MLMYEGSSIQKVQMEFPISIFHWNYRGSNNMEFVENFMELKRGNNPTICLIADTGHVQTQDI